MSPIQRTASLHELIPLIFVEDIDSSVAFYRDKLGFGMAEKWERDGKLAWCRLQRGGSAVMLEQACDEDGPTESRGRGVGFFFLCDDADVMHAELCAIGLRIAPPKIAFYGMKQLFLKDPDGYELCFQNPTERA